MPDQELENLILKLKGGFIRPNEEHVDALIKLLNKLKATLERIEDKLIHADEILTRMLKD